MSDAWDKAKGLADKHASTGGIFVRLANDGDKVVGAFLGDPLPREVHWTGERYEECTGAENKCSQCAESKRPSLRVSMNFYVPAEKAVKVIEGGSTWFKDLLKCRDKYGLDRWTFEVERHGASGDPKTSYTILPDERLTDEQRGHLAGLQLHDLQKVVSGGGEAGGDFSSYDKTGAAGQPIDPRVATELVGRLKVLPRDAVDTFLKKFGVQRVRDLKASDEKAARAFVEALEGKGQKSGGEIDPFA
ncbi:MAG: hypothetical protein JXB32_18205 [Deltaproteobacteria bacterium]|nr:hypothetical protein [Deltaproteobacteria bacterium]